jgi:arginyl-tRNA synthetase
MKQELATAVASAVQKLFGVEVDIVLTRPDEQFGDYATNVALRLAGKLNKNPREIADALAGELGTSNLVAKAEVAGPGFLNLTVGDTALWQSLSSPTAKPLEGEVIVAEYSDPNPFKVLHAGHLYTGVVGDAIANLLEHSGGEVHRVNFGGDVGMHVGKTLWAILQKLGGEHPEKLGAVPEAEHATWMAEAYVQGSNRYDEDESAKAEMVELNKKVYRFHADKDHQSPLAQIYWTCRKWSYEYFDEFYARIGSKFEKYYPESETATLGLETVKAHVPAVFQESDGAIIFRGDDHGLHTRVFINSEGLPTYEAKDVGLIMKKKQDYDFDRSIVITGNEQAQYMAVVLKAIEQFAPDLAQATSHLTHGLVKLAGGVKMSSRKGNILRAVDVLDAAADANKQATGKDDEQVTLGAVKYSFLRQRTGGDIVYDPAESVALEGNSGPYLQYAHARAKSILTKVSAGEHEVTDLQPGERSLVRKLSEYADVVAQATSELMPHLICTYLYELSQVFNRFYEKNRVVGDERESQRAALVAQYADTLSEGLGLLGIAAPEKM